MCCRETHKVLRRMKQLQSSTNYMTKHPGLETVCWTVYSLQKLCQAYRSFVSCCWGHLARKVRFVIPSCEVFPIRKEFPDEDSQLSWLQTAP
ncbi:uncharacterized protein LOC118115439 [Hippoglossus stenolepis]|uniref:uncharacterized protein LOC118115439 n=1 Tax=Hippoglossus stenolepis TaxID=195615 RepID=UPI001FAF4580|nr:uncharacterized protein LOC118115439 [Hippoglossus stenolepis]